MQRVALDNDGVKAKIKYDLQSCGPGLSINVNMRLEFRWFDTVFSLEATVFRHFTR